METDSYIQKHGQMKAEQSTFDMLQSHLGHSHLGKRSFSKIIKNQVEESSPEVMNNSWLRNARKEMGS